MPPDHEHDRIHIRIDEDRNEMQRIEKDCMKRNHETDMLLATTISAVEEVSRNLTRAEGISTKTAEQMAEQVSTRNDLFKEVKHLCTTVDKVNGTATGAAELAMEARTLAGHIGVALAPIKEQYEQAEQEKKEVRKGWLKVGFKIIGVVLCVVVLVILQYFAFRLGIEWPK